MQQISFSNMPRSQPIYSSENLEVVCWSEPTIEMNILFVVQEEQTDAFSGCGGTAAPQLFLAV